MPRACGVGRALYVSLRMEFHSRKQEGCRIRACPILTQGPGHGSSAAFPLEAQTRSVPAANHRADAAAAPPPIGHMPQYWHKSSGARFSGTTTLLSSPLAVLARLRKVKTESGVAVSVRWYLCTPSIVLYVILLV